MLDERLVGHDLEATTSLLIRIFDQDRDDIDAKYIDSVSREPACKPTFSAPNVKHLEWRAHQNGIDDGCIGNQNTTANPSLTNGN